MTPTALLERLQQAAPDREIVMTRLVDAPRALVWEAFTDPAQVARWWGPNGFRNSIREMSVRPGGTWRFTMHGPDGRDYPNRIDYIEVKKPERLVYAHSGGDGPPDFHAVITLAEEAGKTRVTLRLVCDSAETCAQKKKFGAELGGQQTLRRLDDHLACHADAAFVIARDFDASRDLVFKAWTEEERLARWFGPSGFEVFHSRMDLRPGGLYHYGLRSADGKTRIWGRWAIRDVVVPERLVMVISFSDEHAGVARHPFAGEWPLEMLSTVTLEDLGGATRVTIRKASLDAAAAERAAFEAGRASMQKGWTGTLDKLAANLPTMNA
jgi:uncharacterized protein YndB with AHSA1/START domain